MPIPAGERCRLLQSTTALHKNTRIFNEADACMNKGTLDEALEEGDAHDRRGPVRSAGDRDCGNGWLDAIFGPKTRP